MSDNTTPFHAFQSGSPVPAETPRRAIYTHPDDVANDPELTTAEKRALLASWISDARSVENAPTLRRLDSGAVVEVDAILHALYALDEPASGGRAERKRLLPSSGKRRAIPRWIKKMALPRKPDDDDDDPPPAPAELPVPFRPTFVVAHGVRPETLPSTEWTFGWAA